MNNGLILVVEDCPDDIVLTRRAFDKIDLQCDIQIAGDGVEALDYLHSGKFSMPDLVLLDLKLPKVDGFEVLQRIRANDTTRHMPVIVLTSSDEPRDILKCYERGANSYVRKPVEFDKFINSVSNLGLYWLLVNEPVPVLK